MSTSTTATVTRIRVVTNCDHLFEGGDFDPALCDQEATRAAYLERLQAEIAGAYPGARIAITDTTVARTTVSVDTTLDGSLGDHEGGDDRDAILLTEQQVAEDVDRLGERVYAEGLFWA